MFFDVGKNVKIIFVGYLQLQSGKNLRIEVATNLQNMKGCMKQWKAEWQKRIK